jgi:hypothetical protein
VRRLLVFLLVVQTGCYSYRNATGLSLGQGTAVRAYLNTPTDFRLTDISVNNTTVVDGEIVRQATDTLIISVFSLRSQTGFSVPAVGETLKIPTERIAQVDRKRLDPVRTGLLAGAAAAASVLLFAVLDVGGFGGGGGGGKPVPQ